MAENTSSKVTRSGRTKISLSVKMVTASIGLIACTSIALAYVFLDEFNESLLRTRITERENEIRMHGQHILADIEELQHDLVFLSNVPPISGIIRSRNSSGVDPLDGSTDTIWRSRLSTIFHEILAAKPHYLSVRYVLAEDGGNELVRVERHGSLVVETESQQLIHGDAFDHLLAALSLRQGQTYFTDVHLRRSQDIISNPNTAVMDAATPFFDSSGRAIGAVIVQLDFRSILHKLDEANQWNSELTYFATNDQGDYLLHPNSELTFGFEFDRKHRIYDDYPEVKTFYNTWQRQPVISTRTGSDLEHDLLHAIKVQFDLLDDKRFFVIASSEYYSDLIKDVASVRNQTAFVAFLIILGVIPVIIAISRRLFQPLQEATHVIEEYIAGNSEVEFPEPSSDEVGVLIKAFKTMISVVRSREDSMQDSLQAQTRLTSVMDHSTDLIAMFDRSSMSLTYLNPAGVAVLAADGVIDPSRLVLEGCFSPTERDRIENDILPDVDNNGVWNGDTCLIRHDGSELHVSAVFMLHKAATTDTGFYSIICRDISERKRVEILKDQFVSIVNHELRTPLTSIRGALGLIGSGVLGELDPKIQRMVDIGTNNCDRLVRLINDLLDIQRMGDENARFNYDSVNLSNIVGDSIDGLDGYATGCSVRIDFVDNTTGLPIYGDADRLIQVVTNLISNAIKFSPHDGHVVVRLEEHGKECRLSVIDQGPGIPAAMQSKIFDKFSQVDSSSERAKGGTGLGLFIVKEIVDRHGGRIMVESELDKGSAFHVWLPLLKSVDSKLDDLLVANNSTRILICEDNHDVALIMKTELEGLGYQCDITGTAAEAKAKLAADRYHLITVDVELPDQDGISLVRELRETEATKQLPVIVVSASPDGRDAMKGSALQIADWITKPIDFERLRSAVKMHRPSEQERARLLHVEDDSDITDVVREIMADRATVVTATTLDAARKYLATDKFDLCILDLTLPDGKGLELIGYLNSGEIDRVPVVILTADDTASIQESPVVATLVKSQVSNQQLFTTIHECIESSVTERIAAIKSP